jgi:GDPmannose 4,6-dehydratase
MDMVWQGKGDHEKGYDQKTGKRIVEVDPAYFRPTEVDQLLGDPSKAREKLGWKPETSFGDLVAEMVSRDLQAARRDHLLSTHGFDVMNHHE